MPRAVSLGSCSRVSPSEELRLIPFQFSRACARVLILLRIGHPRHSSKPSPYRVGSQARCHSMGLKPVINEDHGLPMTQKTCSANKRNCSETFRRNHRQLPLTVVNPWERAAFIRSRARSRITFVAFWISEKRCKSIENATSPRGSFAAPRTNAQPSSIDPFLVPLVSSRPSLISFTL